MKDTLKTSPNSGSDASESTPKTSGKQKPAVVESGTVRLRSLLDGGGDHPSTGLSVPAKGKIFEADAERAQELVACGLAEMKGE